MGYYVQFDKQGPVNAGSYDKAAWKATKNLIEAIQTLSGDDNPVEELPRIGFKVVVSVRDN